MANGLPPGPWDQEADQFIVDDGTMCRVPSSRPGPLFGIPEPNMSVAPPAQEVPGVTIYVIGSPSKGQKYQYQFVSAADCLTKDASTI